jgi:hypothetical protein
MAIGLRIVILLCCAYAGWQTASVQFGELPEFQQGSNDPNERPEANEKAKA